MACVGCQDSEKAAVGRDGELGDVPRRRKFEQLEAVWLVRIVLSMPGLSIAYPIALPKLIRTTVVLSITQQAQIAPPQFPSHRDEHLSAAVRNCLSRSFMLLLRVRLAGLEKLEARRWSREPLGRV